MSLSSRGARRHAATEPPPLRVAYVVPPSAHFAGIERVTHDLATGLAERGGPQFEVHVLYASQYAEPVLQQTSYVLHQLGARQLRHLPRSVRRWVTAHPVDVLVVPQVEASTLVWLGTRRVGLPALIPHLHGNPRVEEAGGNWSSKLLFALFRRVVAPRVPGILTVSPSLRDFTRTHLSPRSRVLYAPNPVRSISPRSRGADDGVFHFVSLGRLARQKGHDILLSAFAIAKPRLPRAHLTIIGSGEEESSLRHQGHRLGLDDDVTFSGYLSDPETAMGDGDCFVLASRWEGFGVALVEALGMGLPVLATDCEFGPSDIVTDQRFGELVRPEDPEALAEGLVRATHRSADPGAERARRDLAATFARDAVVDAHRRALLELSTRTGCRSRGRG